MVSSLEQLKIELKNINIPGTYHQFRKEDAPGLPFYVYYTSGADTFKADDTTYMISPRVFIELYTEHKNEQIEKSIESILNANDLPFEKSETYLDDEHCWMVIYETTFVEE